MLSAPWLEVLSTDLFTRAGGDPRDPATYEKEKTGESCPGFSGHHGFGGSDSRQLA